MGSFVTSPRLRAAVTAAVLTAGLSAGAVARAGDDQTPAKPPKLASPAEAADAAEAAQRAGDTAALAAIARRPIPNVWIVADLLLESGHREAAFALAHSAPSPETEALPAYLERRVLAPEDSRRRSVVDAAFALNQQKKRAEAVAATEGFPAEPKDVLCVRAHQMRAVALDQMGKQEEAIAEYAASYDVSSRLGWLSYEATSRTAAGRAAAALGKLALAREQLDAAVRLQERRGDAAAASGALGDLAIVCDRLGDHAAARNAFERAVTSAEPVGGAALSHALHNLGNSLQASDGAVAAIPILVRAAELRRAAGAKNELALTLGQLGIAYTAAGRLDDARRSLEEARAIYEAAGDEGQLGRVLRFIGETHYLGGNPKEALAWYEKARIAVARGGNRIEALQVESDAASALDALDRTVDAKALFERTVQELRAIGGTTAAFATALRNLAVVTAKLGDLKGAIPIANEAVTAANACGNVRAAISARQQLGSMLVRTGELEAAEELQRSALASAQSLGDPLIEGTALESLADVADARHDPIESMRCVELARGIYAAHGLDAKLGFVIMRIGACRFTIGDHERALAAYEQAVPLMQKAGLPLRVSECLCHVAESLRDLGREARAMSAFERALAASKEAKDRDGEASSLVNYANLMSAVRREDRAIEMLLQAIAIRTEDGDLEGQATACANLSNAYRRAGRPDDALAFARRAREVSVARGDRSQTAWADLLSGNALRAKRDYDGALRLLADARAAYEALHDDAGAAKAQIAAGWVHFERNDAAHALPLFEAGHDLAGMAECYFALGRSGDAVRACRDAIAKIGDKFAGFSDDEATAAREALSRIAAVGMQASDSADDVFFFVESTRAGALLEAFGARDALRDAVVPAELRDAERLARTREATAAWQERRARQRGDAVALEAAQKSLAAARDERDAVATRIQREAKAASGVVAPHIAQISEVQAALGPGEVLVEYVVHDLGVALVISAKGMRSAALGTAEEIRQAVAALRADDGAADPAPALAALRKRVVEPLGLGDDVKRVLVSPADLLSFAPFGLLFGDREVVHLPSASTYLLLRGTSSARGEGVLAIGDPDYGAKAAPDLVASDARRDAMNLVPLPATAAEARAIGTMVLLGKDATEQGLRDALAKKTRWRAVHLACHGLVDSERPMRSALALAPSVQDDGLLSALDVFRMRVPADLAVLSACETGRGKACVAEGIVGLTRAFMFAGAPRVLVSLWKVDDAATLALMKRFYERWNEGVPASRALRDAQQFVASQDKWRHPRFWAAWSLWGLGD